MSLPGFPFGEHERRAAELVNDLIGDVGGGVTLAEHDEVVAAGVCQDTSLTVEGEDRLRRVWVELAGDDYETAVRAHRDMRLVSVRGDIVRRGNRSYLSRAGNFQILPDAPG